MKEDSDSTLPGDRDANGGELFRRGLAASVAMVLTGAVAIGGAALLLLWLASGKPQLQQIESLTMALTLDALTFAGGLVVVLGGTVALVVAYRRQRLGEAEHVRQGEVSQRDQARLFNERFARASDQLGSQRPAIRLAGIYAMAGLADDWENGRQACIDVLCAYLRMPYHPTTPPPSDLSPHARPRPWEVGQGTEADGAGTSPDLAEMQVRASVIQALRDRLWSDAPVSWNGAHLDFRGAVFEDASFDGLDFIDCTVDFSDCLFVGECSFAETTWRRTKGWFTGAVFGGRVGFEYSTFEDSDITLYGDFTASTDLNLQGITLNSGTLRFLGPRKNGGSISFVGANLLGGEIQMHPSLLHENSSIAFSRSTIAGTNVVIQGGEYKSGHLWCNGVNMSAGSFAFEPMAWACEPVALEGSELSFDALKMTGGEVALRDVSIAGSDVHFDDLELIGGRLVISSCELSSGTLRFANPTIAGGEVVIVDSGGDAAIEAIAHNLREAGARLTDDAPRDERC